MLRPSIAAAACLGLLACVPGGTALAQPARPTGEAVLSALILEAGAVTPLYQNNATGPAISIADGAFDAAFMPDGDVAYVIGGGHVTPIAINADQRAVAGTPIALPHSSHSDAVAIAITPNGKTALVVDNFSPYWVSWIDTATGTVTAKIRAGADPLAIAITPNGKYAYVANVDSDTVTAINIAQHRVIRTIRSRGFDPAAIAITPDGRFAYVADNGSGTVTPIRISTNTALRPIRVGKVPADIVMAPGGRYAYVTNNGSGTVSKIRLSARRVVKTIRTGGYPEDIVLTPDGKFGYVSSWDELAIKTHLRTVTAIRLSSGAVLRQITVGRDPIALGMSVGGTTVYSANWRSDTVSPISVATNTAGPAITLAGYHEPEFIAIRP
jgi:YVTN family beta-propeller protein